MTSRKRYSRRRRYGRVEPVQLLLADDGQSLFVAVMAGLARLLYRYRSELRPVGIGIAVVICGAWLHYAHPHCALGLALTTAVIAAALAFVPASWTRWLMVGPVLDRRVERIYAVVVTAFVGSWLTAVTAVGVTTKPLPTIALVGGVVCALPWWTHHRRRHKAKVARALSAWPDIAEQAGLPGSRVLSFLVDAFGYTVRLALRKGQTIANAVTAIAGIESALGLRVGSVRVEPEPKRADRVVLRVIETDPHATPIPLPEVTQPAGASISKRLPLGVFEDGQAVGVLVKGRHVLIGGTTGAGKSGLVNVFLADLSECADVVIWGIDLKGGMELNPWRGCLGALATSPNSAIAVLRAAVDELDRRANILTQAGSRDWQPTSEHPALVVVIDEYAELPDHAKELADSIARRGRAVCVTLLIATQRPTQASMGAGAVRSQMDVRICLRVRERRDVDLILGQGALYAGWQAHTLDAPGKFLISSPEHQNPRRARGYLLTDEGVRRTAARNTAIRPPFPRLETELDGSASRGVTTAEPHANLSQAERQEASNAVMLLWDALVDADETGATVEELISVCGMSRRWVYLRLQDHLTAGRISQPTRGRYRAIPPASSTESDEPT